MHKQFVRYIYAGTCSHYFEEFYIQEDLDGFLFNFNEIFPNMECSGAALGGFSELGGFTQVITEESFRNSTFSDELFGQLTQGDVYYVNAQFIQVSDGKYLYAFEEDEDQPENSVVIAVSEMKGNCIGFTSIGGKIIIESLDCSEKHKPLCLSIEPSSVGNIEKACDRLAVQWFEMSEIEDGDVRISGVELLLNPREEANKEEAESFCEVIYMAIN